MQMGDVQQDAAFFRKVSSHCISWVKCWSLLQASLQRVGKPFLPQNYINPALEIDIQLGFTVTSLSILAENNCCHYTSQFVGLGDFPLLWLLAKVSLYLFCLSRKILL